MSFNTPFFNFFDAINNEVDTFNRLLDTNGYKYYQPRRQQLTATGDEKSAGKEIAETKGKSSNEVSQARKNDLVDLDDWSENDWSLLPRDFVSTSLTPPVDILEHDKNYEIKITIPGVKDKKDINIEYHKEKHQIAVTGEIPSSLTAETKEKVKVQERASGKFKRFITLPDYPGIDADKIKADYSGGILTLTIPKLEPTKDGKNAVHKIEISSEESWNN